MLELFGEPQRPDDVVRDLATPLRHRATTQDSFAAWWTLRCSCRPRCNRAVPAEHADWGFAVALERVRSRRRDAARSRRRDAPPPRSARCADRAAIRRRSRDRARPRPHDARCRARVLRRTPISCGERAAASPPAGTTLGAVRPRSLRRRVRPQCRRARSRCTIRGRNATVDRARHARAFGDAPGGPEQTPALLHELGMRSVLEVGCGQGSLLRAMALADEQFHGWGLEASRTMCQVARAGVRDAGLAGRINIVHGDGHVPSATSARAVEAVDSIVAHEFVNELFARDTVDATDWLVELRTTFPGRLLLIADYSDGSVIARAW